MFESLKNLLKHFTGSQNTESAEPVASNQESEPLSAAAVEQITESTTAETTPISRNLHAESVTNIEATQVSAAAAINQETEVSSESQSTPPDDNKNDT